MTPDEPGMRRLGIEADSIIGVRASECGFTPFLRDDGLHPNPANPDTEYFQFLRKHGLEADNPWEDYANSHEGDDGEALSGWFLKNARKSARVPAHLSESAFLTDQAISFMQQAEEPWVAHVSYIKPHWPYIAPSPYHEMYGPEHVIEANRTEAEKIEAHPVLSAFRQERYAKAFSRDEVRETVIPTYMGLISEVDTHVGRLIQHLKEIGQYESTMIIFCSDHGDYLGDHWMGEKQMFHDPSVRVPLIIRDPRNDADVSRGKVCDEMVEMIDIAPTLLDLYGAPPKDHILEGTSLLPILKGRDDSHNKPYVFSEYQYAEDRAGWQLAHPIKTAMARMVANQRWKFVHFEHAEPLLYDRQNDPRESTNLATSLKHADVIHEMTEVLHAWARNPQSNICMPFFDIKDYQDRQSHYDECAMQGYLIGYWSEDEFLKEKEKQAAYEAARSDK
jgi:arylsulfatase A-like enzyme